MKKMKLILVGSSMANFSVPSFRQSTLCFPLGTIALYVVNLKLEN